MLGHTLCPIGLGESRIIANHLYSDASSCHIKAQFEKFDIPVQTTDLVLQSIEILDKTHSPIELWPEKQNGCVLNCPIPRWVIANNVKCDFLVVLID